jgi:hypothetical protein
MPKTSSARIQDHFADLTDPRRRPVTYPLINIVTIAICAVHKSTKGPGGPGRLPARGSHRPERAPLTHSVPRVIHSLRLGTVG